MVIHAKRLLQSINSHSTKKLEILMEKAEKLEGIRIKGLNFCSEVMSSRCYSCCQRMFMFSPSDNTVFQPPSFFKVEPGSIRRSMEVYLSLCNLVLFRSKKSFCWRSNCQLARKYSKSEKKRYSRCFLLCLYFLAG